MWCDEEELELEMEYLKSISVIPPELEKFVSSYIDSRLEKNDPFALKLDGKLTLSETRKLLLESGNKFLKIEMESFDNDTESLTLVLKLCPNLMSIYLVNLSDITPLKTYNSWKIKLIALDGCKIDDSCKTMFSLSNWPELKHVIISRAQISGRVLSGCRFLESIDICACPAVTLNDMKDTLTENSDSLRHLSICNLLNDTFDIKVLESLINTGKLRNLEVLKMFFVLPPNMNFISKLAKLKSLLLSGVFNFSRLLNNLVDRTVLEELQIIGGRMEEDTCAAVYKLKKLNKLHILHPSFEHVSMISGIQMSNLQDFVGFNCMSINNANAVLLVKSCLKLQKLCLWDCPNVNFDAVRDIIRLLRIDEFDSKMATPSRAGRPQLEFFVNTAVVGTKEKVK